MTERNTAAHNQEPPDHEISQTTINALIERMISLRQYAEEAIGSPGKTQLTFECDKGTDEEVSIIADHYDHMLPLPPLVTPENLVCTFDIASDIFHVSEDEDNFKSVHIDIYGRADYYAAKKEINFSNTAESLKVIEPFARYLTGGGNDWESEVQNAIKENNADVDEDEISRLVDITDISTVSEADGQWILERLISDNLVRRHS